MLKFSTKSLLFILPFVILVKLPSVIPFTFHEDLNRKSNTFLDKNKLQDIIIAGDSRAERQLIPNIFEKRLDKNTVNIAVNSGDITMLYNSLRKENLLDSNSTIIISVSSIEMNDNVINKWGIPHAAVAKISEWNNMKLFNEHYLNMIHERIRLMFTELFLPKVTMGKDDPRNSTVGFRGIEGDISHWDFKTIDLMEDTLKVGWYLNGIYDGARKEVFNEVINQYSRTNLNLILFQAPVSPAWYSHIKNTYIDSIEHNHIDYLNEIAEKHANISFIDFYSNLNPVYHDSMFYNSIHFNKYGAEIFTNALIDSLIDGNHLEPYFHKAN